MILNLFSTSRLTSKHRSPLRRELLVSSFCLRIGIFVSSSLSFGATKPERHIFCDCGVVMIRTMSLFWTLIILFFTIGNYSEAKYVKTLPSHAVVFGTSYCDTCIHHKYPQIRHFISGASVVVECKDTSSPRISFRQEVKTNNNGEFKVYLPPYISKHVRKIKGCSVNLLSSSHPNCAVAATACHHFRSGKRGSNIFSEGFLTLNPMKEPEVCDERPGVKNFKNLKAEKSSISNPNDPAFLPPIQDPTPPEQPALGVYLPPLPLLPRLPPLTPLPGIPYLPPKA